MRRNGASPRQIMEIRSEIKESTKAESMVSLRSIIHCSLYHWTYASKITTLQYWVYIDLCSLYRSTPVEVLHTILLRLYKYLTREVMSHLSSRQREEVKANLKAFSYSGIKGRVYGDVTKYCGSFCWTRLQGLGPDCTFHHWPIPFK